MLFNKRLEDITADDLFSLRDDEVPESKQLDYKRDAIGSNDEDKKEFLADVSSFANASGGDLIIGIEEKGGVPIAVEGLAMDTDQEITRLESMIQTGISPRIAGLHLHKVSLPSGNAVIVVRVPRSFMPPHMVTAKMRPQFYVRGSAGKMPMTIDDIRSIAVTSATLAERARAFRAERLSRVLTGESPVLFTGRGAPVVLHIVPFSALSGVPSVDLRLVAKAPGHETSPFSDQTPSGWNSGWNVDGFAVYTPMGPDHCAQYNLYFRSGAVEAGDEYLALRSEGSLDFGTIHAAGIERAVLSFLKRTLQLTSRLEIDPPFLVMLSLLQVRGFRLMRDDGTWQRAERERPVTRDELLLPDVVIESTETNLGKALRPVFDALWNALGYSGSPNYDQDGHFIARGSRR